MPWKVVPVSDLRLAFVHHVRSLHTPVAQACRQFGISRKTGHKWLGRAQEGSTQPLLDRSRRPHHSPGRTAEALEQAVLEVRDQFGWGPRKIRAYLNRHGLVLPSVRTLAAILHRHGRSGPKPPAAAPLQSFERAEPNQLWQCDFKGPLEVAKQRVHPFTILDDHSRYLLALRPCLDLTMATAWSILWELFGSVGLPECLLCDNAFGSRYHAPGLSWFEAQLLRLGIRTTHGRPAHPQTQGKIERLHGTLERELWPRVRCDLLEHFQADLEQWRSTVYNLLRPHEALDDLPPVTRWRPSPRPRPATLPPLDYPPGSVLRKVSDGGSICWQHCYLQVGKGLAGDYIRLEEHDGWLVLFYAQHPFRRLPTSALKRRALV